MFSSFSNQAKGLLITGLGVLVISPDGLLVRLISADVLTISFWRGLFYSTGMLVLLVLYYRKRVVEAFFNIGIPGLWMATLYFLGNLSFIYSLTHTTVANTLFIISTTPFFAALIAWLFLKQKVDRRTWIAISAASAGIAIICSGKNVMPDAHLGNLAGLVAAFTLAVSFTLVAHYRDRDLLPSFVLGGFLMALVLEPFVLPSQTTDRDLLYLFLMGFIMLPVAATMMFLGPKYISAPEVGLLMLLESVFGPLWVWIMLKEQPGNLTLVGGTIVIATLAVHSVLAMKKASAIPGKRP
ncbi:MAG: DMT family transporter [Gammaproteobacteria bacterium]|nr:DMT family transporter [Gammaproteobacteria bacterium]